MKFTLTFSKASQSNNSIDIEVKERELTEVILESKNETLCFNYS